MSNEHAFPFDFTMEPSKGLTKREYMAAHVAAALVPKLMHHTRWEIAEQAVLLADALLEELQK